MSLHYACQKWSRSPEQEEQNPVHSQNKTSQTKGKESRANITWLYKKPRSLVHATTNIC